MKSGQTEEKKSPSPTVEKELDQEPSRVSSLDSGKRRHKYECIDCEEKFEAPNAYACPACWKNNLRRLK